MPDFSVYKNLGRISKEQDETKKKLKLVISYLMKHDEDFRRYVSGKKGKRHEKKKNKA